MTPTVLLAVRRYVYNGKQHGCDATVAALREDAAAAGRTLSVIFVPFLPDALAPEDYALPLATSVPGATPAATPALTPAELPALHFEVLSCADPVYVLYTSGTTGAPKAIAQGFGVHVNHLKETLLQLDIGGPRETCFVYTNTGWMLWHWLVSLLHTGATLVTYDGSPNPRNARPDALWRVVAEEKVTYFGCSARFLDTTCQGMAQVFAPEADPEGRSETTHKAVGEEEEEEDDTGAGGGGSIEAISLSTISGGAARKKAPGNATSGKKLPPPTSLRLISSTGSPLSDTTATAVMAAWPWLRLHSISGGTELNGCLCIGAAVLPVTANQIQCPPLGMDVCVFPPADHTTGATPAKLPQRVFGEEGELVCLTPFPSMPLHFYGDAGNARYRASYFETYGPCVWAHSDAAEQTACHRRGFVIRGRSDATLNPGGVRMGTAEFYRVLKEHVRWVEDAVIVDAKLCGMALFVVVSGANGANVESSSLRQPTADQLKQLKTVIRQQLSPKHVPAHIVAVPAVPYNRNFKKVEVIVKRALDAPVGVSDAEAAWRPLLDNLQDPAVMAPYVAFRDALRRRATAKL